MEYLKLPHPFRKTWNMYPTPPTYKSSILRRLASSLGAKALEPKGASLENPRTPRAVHCQAWELTTDDILVTYGNLHRLMPKATASVLACTSQVSGYSTITLLKGSCEVFIKGANASTIPARTHLPLTPASYVTNRRSLPARALAASLRLWAFTGNKLTDEQGIELYGDAWVTFSQFFLRNLYQYWEITYLLSYCRVASLRSTPARIRATSHLTYGMSFK